MRGHGFDHVGHREDPRFEKSLVAANPQRISALALSLVMLEDDLGDGVPTAPSPDHGREGTGRMVSTCPSGRARMAALGEWGMQKTDAKAQPGEGRAHGSLEERFAQLFEAMSDPAYLVHTESGRVLACNAAAVRQTGYSRRELIGMNIGADFKPADDKFDASSVAARLAAGGSARFAHRKRRKDGSAYWDEVLVVPFQPVPERVHISINHDITDRVEKERALAESEIRYRNIFESTTDAIFVFDLNGTIVEANPNACRMYGYADGELVGLPARAIIRPDYYHGFANFRDGIEKNGRFLARSVNLRKDATPMDVEVHGGPFVFRGAPHLLAVVRDVREQMKVERQLQETGLKLERLHEAANRLETCRNEEEVYRATVGAAEEILRFGLCSLDIVEGDRLMVKATSAGLAPEASVAASLSEENLATTTLRTRRTTMFGRPEEVPAARPTKTGFQSGISAPIGNVGVFQVASEEENAFTAEDVRLLDLLLGHTAQAIARIRLEEELVTQANRDPLTGVYNRRYFNQVIEQELARSKRYAHPIGFLMVDVNRFKEINDQFGHQTGDRVLQAVASLLNSALRECDLVVRYGGDEFLVVLLETNGESSLVKDRILDAVKAREGTTELVPFPVTLSIGSAHWNPESDQTVESVLSEADARMYAAKRESGEAKRG
jgi:diguanylate cyclase (GGDEF)-like protein/PAS domain S-box-containing protein